MEKVMNSYECLFVASLENGEDAAKETVNKFTKLIADNGETLNVAEWGKRRLAYPINDMNEGYYCIVTFKSVPTFIAELDRLFNIDESIMRKMVIRLEHEPVFKNEEVEPAAEEVEAPAEAPVEAPADAE